MLSILSSILLMATILYRLLSEYPLLRLDFGLWYIWKGPVSLSRPVFSNRRRTPLKFERDNKFHSRAQTMKIGLSAFNQGRGPQYQPWGNIGMGGRTIPCFWTYTSIDESTHLLSTVWIFPRMKLGYVSWLLPRLIRIRPVYWGAWWKWGDSFHYWLDCGVHNCQEFQQSLFFSSVSRVVKAICAGLEVSLLEDRGLWPGNWGSREGGGLSQMETGFTGPNPWTLSHCHSDPAERSSDTFLDANSLRPGVSETSFPNSR